MMPNTFVSLHYHIVFATKHREPWIAENIEGRIWSYLAGIASQNGMIPHRIGVLEDHVHVVVDLPATLLVSRAVQMLKGSSSRWIRQTFPYLEAFNWQEGYGAFTVSTSALPATVEYVQRQRARHRAQTFQEEFRGLLDGHQIEYDDRYLWS